MVGCLKEMLYRVGHRIISVILPEQLRHPMAYHLRLVFNVGILKAKYLVNRIGLSHRI